MGMTNFDKAINQSDLEEWIMETFPDWCEGDVRLIMDHMDEMPSVTPQEPKTGHWIGHREHCENLGVMPSGLGAYEWCSNCDCSIDVREWHRNHYNYCPRCGAKMVEPQESEGINGSISRR